MKKTNGIMLLLVLTCLLASNLVFASVKYESAQKPINSDLTEEEFTALKQYYRKHKAQFGHIQKSTQSAPAYLNALIKEDSPYLQKHAFNPINWQAWSDKSLNKAAQNDKLIFLSIGFATCFWCQVMEQESFNNMDIAKFLNSHFVSIKVDREVHPEVDEFYSQALNVVKGSSGWPVTAILAPDRSPIFMESYVDLPSLLRLLQRVQKIWQQSPDFFAASSQQILNMVVQRTASSATAEIPDNIPYPAITQQLLTQLDDVEGGFSGEPKFPSEGMLLFALDALKRTGDPGLKASIKRQLDNMASRGLYDHVYGGFHRYSSDASWMQPHYEKMLYNQGLMLLVYRRAYDVFPEATYKQVLSEIIHFVTGTLYDRQNGLYSSVDAVYNGKEGGFYLYSADHLKQIKPQILEAAGARYLQQENSALSRILFRRPYSPETRTARNKLLSFKDPLALFIDKKNIAAWSGLFIWGLAESYDVLQNKRVLDLAEELASQVEQLHMTPQQLYRIYYNGSTSVPATLEDFSYLSRAFIALYDRTFNPQWLKRARELLEQSINHLHKTGQGFRFSSNSNLPVNLVNTFDGELPNAQAVMLEVMTMLHKREAEPYWQSIERPLKSMLTQKVLENPMAHLYSVKAVRKNQQSTLDSTQFFARGNGRIRLTPQKDCSYSLRFNLREGWHVNSNLPQAEDLIATSITLNNTNNSQVFFPGSEIIYFGPSKREISVFENTFTVLISGESERAQIDLQACSTIENICLLPESVNFYLPVCPWHAAQNQQPATSNQ